MNLIKNIVKNILLSICVCGHTCMVNMGKHTSLDTPPDKPFFCGSKKRLSSQVSTADVAPTDISPIKRSNLRSQYMTQMRDWHALFEAAAITKEYEDQKGRILEDLKKL